MILSDHAPKGLQIRSSESAGVLRDDLQEIGL
jgi:hypothetical protein